jgi:hypothetical protein
MKTNNRNYLITNSHRGFKVELSTARPNAKRAKILTLKTANKTLKLNGYQINTLKKVFAKENALNSSKSTIY